MRDIIKLIIEYEVPENIHTHLEEGHWKFQGGGGSQKPKLLKESMKENWNFQRGGGSKQENPLWEGYGYFTERHNLIFEKKYTININN